MNRPAALLVAGILWACCIATSPAQDAAAKDAPSYPSLDVKFTSHDGHAMFGKLVLPKSAAPRAIVLYVQTAESATVDQKRPLGRSKTFNYFDLYRTTLTAKGIGFFSYEGRGVRTGDSPPRFEQIDWEAFNTGTLDNKVKDILSAIEAVRRQPQCALAPILLMGASEGALLAAEAAAQAPASVAGLVIYGVLATNMRENFKYIMTDGAFLAYRLMFDTDRDGLVSNAEFEADPKQYRRHVLQNADFKMFDHNGDGNFSADEMAKLTRLYVDAVDNEKFDVLQAWAKQNAAVAVPENWFKDHFAHRPLANFLLKLNIPAGCFHGAQDTNASIAAVKALEREARRAGKTNLAFHYFDDLDHTLNIGEYFAAGRLPAGHKAIFDFIDRVVEQGTKASP